MQANVPAVDHENGMMTLGLTPELDEGCRIAHEGFLAARRLTYWQLIVVQIPGTPHFLIFSGATGGREIPDYTLAVSATLIQRIEEILTAHYEQCYPNSPREVPVTER